MAKAFLASDGREIDYYLARSEGKIDNQYHSGPQSRDSFGRAKPYTKTAHNRDSDITKRKMVWVKGEYIYDKLEDVPKSNGLSGSKLFIGVPRADHVDRKDSLYVVGTKSAIIRMFEAATVTPEILAATPLRIGVYKWKNILTASIYGVRVSAGAPPRSAGKHDFVDTDVTQILGLTGKQNTICPGILRLPVKNILDGKAG